MQMNWMKETADGIKTALANNKKKIAAVLGAALLLAGAKEGAEYMFEIKGVVSGVNDRQIAVADFWTTRTADLAYSPVAMPELRLGDAVKIKKNLQGTVISIEVKHEKEGREKRTKRIRASERLHAPASPIDDAL